ncbi:TPA: glycosyltransferase family 2 protein [Campylobacter coli]|nr:glycosyltransferase family 2 protein [Campylobacter coli]
MLGLNQRKLQKFKKNPKLFFKDAIKKRILSLSDASKRCLPKEYKAFTKYAIISAVYNVEKYLDDYFKSIINQRLDFKNNIFIILVDDGSTDNSAQIIKKYQKKYPKNIIYLYKENGGQASARNLGLKYLKENDLGASWVTFTDPDDFLDQSYFYEVDKNLEKYKYDDIALVFCPFIFFYELTGVKAHHNQFDYVFGMGVRLVPNCQMDNDLSGVTSTNLFLLEKIGKLRFNEFMRYGNEDTVFLMSYIINTYQENTIILPESRYFYRKRADKSSTIDTIQNDKNTYLLTFEEGYLKFLKSINFLNIKIPPFIQKQIITAVVWNLHSFINNDDSLDFLTEAERNKYLQIFDEIFIYIDKEVIFDFFIISAYQFHQMGMVNCFKHEYDINYQKAWIEKVDYKNNSLLIAYFTPNYSEEVKIQIDHIRLKPLITKIVQYDFINRVFIYKKMFWVEIPNYTFYFRINFFIENMNCFSIKIRDVYDMFEAEKKKNLSLDDVWVFIDHPEYAGDNAESLYRYFDHFFPEKNILFALKKQSSDWNRLEGDKFRLVDIDSFGFNNLIKKCKKIISSQLIYSCIDLDKKEGQFIYFPSGDINHSHCNIINSSNIDLMFVLRDFYNPSIDFSRFALTSKEVKVLEAPPRFEYLSFQKRDKKNIILIMPKFFNYVNSKDEKEFYDKWEKVLTNHSFLERCKRDNLQIIFSVESEKHFNYFKKFGQDVDVAYGNQYKIFPSVMIFITDCHDFAYDASKLFKCKVLHYGTQDEIIFKYSNIYGDLYSDIDCLVSSIFANIQNKTSFFVDKNINISYFEDICKILNK